MTWAQNIHKQTIEPLLVNVSSTQAGLNRGSGILVSSVHSIYPDAEDSPLYAVEGPREDSLQEMFRIMADPERFKLFERVASEALCSENITFLKAVAAFKQRSEVLVAEQSSKASNDMMTMADSIIKQHIGSAAEEEVNICSKTRNILTVKRGEWLPETPILTLEKAREVLEADKLRRVELFDTAHKEISIMLYQNLWNRFRSLETTVNMASNSKKEDTIYRDER